jgi:flavin-dependent dehydrogenase
MTHVHDVVIVGAGPAGGSLAAALARQGWDVVLIEKRTLPHHKVCGEFLSPESQASLKALGVFEPVANLHPCALTHAQIVTAGQQRLRVPLPAAAWGISRYALDDTLAHAAQQAGAKLLTGVSATGLIRRAVGWEVGLRSSATIDSITARTVILACGRHTVPGLRPTRPTLPPEQSYVGGKCHYQGLTMPPQVELFLFPGGYVGINPIEHGRVNLAFLVTRAAFNAAGGTVLALIAAAAQANPAFAERLAGAQLVANTDLATAPVDTDAAARPWEQVARLGDAATMIPPLCGDGMAMALRSAELCAPLVQRFLRHELSEAAFEHAFCRAWHTEFDRRLWLGRRLQRLLSYPTVANALLRVGRWLPALSTAVVAATRGKG